MFDALRARFNSNAEEFDSLMTVMIQKSEQLQQENTELKSQLEALQAHVVRLRTALDAMNGPLNYIPLLDITVDELLNETPPQSLNHIEARVEEETIREFAGFVVMQLEGMASEQAMREIYACAERKPRKYAKQEKEEGE